MNHSKVDKIFDFNIHLPKLNSNTVNSLVQTEMNATPKDLITRFDDSSFIKNIDGANLMLFNSDFFNTNDSFVKHVKSKLKQSSFTLLIDFRNDNWAEHINNGIDAGINCIKFHSYQQQITHTDYEKIIEICTYAESKKLIICLDGSYGTSNMVKYDIVDFICAIANKIEKTPIVVLHSGGLKCMEIMLLALDKKNIYLETSVTLHFYQGSSIEKDLAFIYKKIESHKILFASDSPYFNFEETRSSSIDFFTKNNFKDKVMEDIFYHNAVNLLNQT